MSQSPSRSPAHAGPLTQPEARPDLNYAVKDLRRTMLRVADNLRWYEQWWLGVPIWQLADDLIALQRIVFDALVERDINGERRIGGEE